MSLHCIVLQIVLQIVLHGRTTERRYDFLARVPRGGCPAPSRFHSNYENDVGGQIVIDKLADGTEVPTTARIDRANASFEPPGSREGPSRPDVVLHGSPL